MAFAIAGVLGWSAWYITTNLHGDTSFWHQLEERYRAHFRRAAVISFPLACAAALGAFAGGSSFGAGILAAWACAIAVVIIAWLTGGIRPSRFKD